MFPVNDCSSLDNVHLLFGVTQRYLTCNKISTYDVDLHFTQLLHRNKALKNVSKTSDAVKKRKSDNAYNLYDTFQDRFIHFRKINSLLLNPQLFSYKCLRKKHGESHFTSEEPWCSRLSSFKSNPNLLGFKFVFSQ